MLPIYQLFSTLVLLSISYAEVGLCQRCRLFWVSLPTPKWLEHHARLVRHLYGAFFADYQQHFNWYYLLVLLRKFLTGAVVGLLWQVPIAAVVLLFLIYATYMLLLCFFRPYNYIKWGHGWYIAYTLNCHHKPSFLRVRWSFWTELWCLLSAPVVLFILLVVFIVEKESDDGGGFFCVLVLWIHVCVMIGYFLLTLLPCLYHAQRRFLTFTFCIDEEETGDVEIKRLMVPHYNRKSINKELGAHGEEVVAQEAAAFQSPETKTKLEEDAKRATKDREVAGASSSSRQHSKFSFKRRIHEHRVKRRTTAVPPLTTTGPRDVTQTNPLYSEPEVRGNPLYDGIEERDIHHHLQLFGHTDLALMLDVDGNLMPNTVTGTGPGKGGPHNRNRRPSMPMFRLNTPRLSVASLGRLPRYPDAEEADMEEGAEGEARLGKRPRLPRAMEKEKEKEKEEEKEEGEEKEEVTEYKSGASSRRTSVVDALVNLRQKFAPRRRGSYGVVGSASSLAALHEDDEENEEEEGEEDEEEVLGVVKGARGSPSSALRTSYLPKKRKQLTKNPAKKLVLPPVHEANEEGNREEGSQTARSTSSPTTPATTALDRRRVSSPDTASFGTGIQQHHSPLRKTKVPTSAKEGEWGEASDAIGDEHL
ncbi:hypothetical protein QOT17_006391 [Balamuthia mandrillaris]